MDKFGDWILVQLNDRGWTQAELARRAHTTDATISRVVAGGRQVGPDMATAIARAFGESPERVFRLAGILPPLPPAVDEEREAMALFRSLPAAVRDVVLTVLRALAMRDGVAMAARGVAEGDTVYAPADMIEHTIEQEAEELRRIWREVHRLDPEAAKRLMGIAVLQAEMVQSAAAARKNVEEEADAR